MQNPHNNFQNVDQKIANLSINSNNSTSTKVSIEQSEYQEFLNFKRSKERNNSSNSSQNGTKQKRNSSQNSPVLSSSSTHSSRHTSNRQRSSENYNPTLSKLPLNNQSRAFHHTQGIGQQCNNSFEDSVHSDASYISKRDFKLINVLKQCFFYSLPWVSLPRKITKKIIFCILFDKL